MSNTSTSQTITGITLNNNNSLPNQMPETSIKWNVYNFPPCLKLIHFNIQELQALVKKTILLLYIQLWLIISITATNCNLITYSPIHHCTGRIQNHYTIRNL